MIAGAVTVGVDLAADPRGTGLATLVWTPGRAELVDLRLGATDADIVTATFPGAVVGLDCPVGWPDAFVDFVVDVRARRPIVLDGAAARKPLVYRPTDVEVHRRTGRWPLSVSADRLGVTAMRGAALLTTLGDAGVEIDRSSQSGRVFEVYPGAALTLWRFDKKGYRVDPAVRERLLADILTVAPWLDVGEYTGLMVASADAFDAVLAALVARVAALGRFAGPPRELADQASREGWVILPDVDLADLVGSPSPPG